MQPKLTIRDILNKVESVGFTINHLNGSLDDVEYMALKRIALWFWNNHYVWIDVDLVVVENDYEYQYRIKHLPRKFHYLKLSKPYFNEYQSYRFSFFSHSGTWNTVEEALIQGINKALTLIN